MASRLVIHDGKRFGKLLVLRTDSHNGLGRLFCRCDCGTERHFRSTVVVRGDAQSCGLCHGHRDNYIDITGQRFHKLLVVGPSHRDKTWRWHCVCDCGQKVVVSGHSLRRGGTKSCGCGKGKRPKYGSTAVKKMAEYRTWSHIKDRCSNRRSNTWKYYGARGIRVCQRWLDSFENFLADMGLRPSDAHQIDRIDNNGNYEPGNCRWATQEVQANNTRRNVYIEHAGLRLTIRQWSQRNGICEGTIQSRLRAGWSTERALTEPIGLVSGPKGR